MYLTLRHKILLLLTCAIVAMAATVTVALTVLAQRETVTAARRDVQAARGVLSKLMRERSHALEDRSLLIADQPLVKAVVQAGDSATISDSAKDLCRQINADALVFTDARGRVLGFADRTKLGIARHKLTAVANAAGVTEALQGRAWVGVVRGFKLPAVQASVPIRIGPAVWGTLTAYRMLARDEAAAVKDILGSDIAFVAGDRVVMASAQVGETLAAPTDTPLLVNLRGTQYFALYAPLPDTQRADHLGFITLLPYRRAMSFFLWFRLAIVLVSAFTLVAALGASSVLSRTMTRPVEEVVTAAYAMRDGQWPAPLPARGTDELSMLQTVFNEMIGAVRNSQETLLALLDRDPLTNLDNHRRFQERLDTAVAVGVETGSELTLVLLDVDHFHDYNKLHGHAAGDALLQKLAAHLQAHLANTTVARYGGEEFAVLMEGVDVVDATARVTALLPIWSTACGGAVTLSAGCAGLAPNTSQSDTLALAAELAVAQAKQLGRNRVCMFSAVPGAPGNSDPHELHRFLKDGSLATIQALAAAVDAKDPYTQGHSQRVAEFASALARALGAGAETVDLIYITGTLHDVGKIGVPDAVLNKPGLLTAEERAIIETHPALGELIIRKVPQLAATLPGVRNHHERWDGAGYPDKLAADEIPYIARVLAVADSFDAMTSDRPYRKGMAAHIALERIRQGAGTQFDARVALAFVELMESGTELRRAA